MAKTKQQQIEELQEEVTLLNKKIDNILIYERKC